MFQGLGAKFGGALQDLSDIAGLQRRAAELAEQGLLSQTVRKLLPCHGGRFDGSRYRLLPR